MHLALVLIVGLIGVALSAPLEQEPVAIVAQESDIQPDGTFRWTFETADGVKQEQNGQPKQIDQETPIVVQGSASWTDNEGKSHQLTYIADENGYQPQSEDIPKPPEAIAKLIEYIAAHPEEKQTDQTQ